MSQKRIDAVIISLVFASLIFLIAFLLGNIAAEAFAQTRPQAVFSVSKQRGAVTETFKFDASDSVNSQGQIKGLNYFWDFGDGVTAQGKNTSHKYQNEGIYQATLKITEASGIFDSTMMEIRVVEAIPPDLQFYIAPTSGTTDDTFKFQAVTVSFIGSNRDQLLMRWDFDGDGSFDTEFNKTKEVVHVYGREGLYTPVAELKDLDGSITKKTGYTVTRNGQIDNDQIGRVVVKRGTNRNLTASFTVSPTAGVIGERFYFDASDSIGFDRLMYRWDFDGDDIFDTQWQYESTANHVYGYDGEKRAVLQIKDSNSVIIRAVRTVTVEKSRARPELDFSVQVPGLVINQQAPAITVGSEVRFTPLLRSRNEPISSLELRWDFDGNGSFDTEFGKQSIVTHRYLNSGVKNVKLQVRDRDGNISELIRSITITDNEPPGAAIKVEPLRGTVSTDFRFDASGVSDSETQVGQLKVRWDFDNDGIFETEFSGRKVETFRYATIGTKKAIVQVIDRQGSLGVAEVSVEVVASTAPEAHLTVTPREGLLTTTFQLDASESLDHETSDNRKLLYEWNYGEETDTASINRFLLKPKASARYTTPGTKTIIVRVKDPDGNVGEARETVVVHWAADYLNRASGINIGLSGTDANKIKLLAEPINRLNFLRLVLFAEAGRKKMIFADMQKLLKDVSLPFADIGKLSIADKALLAEALKRGIISSNATFNPDRSLSRAEALKIIFSANGLVPEVSGNTGFGDVDPDFWPAPYVKRAESIGLVRGYGDGTFRPFNSVSTSEALKITFKGQEF